MYSMGMKGTKWDIFNVSVDLFAKRGYNNVSMRDIAAVAGIKAASIYNHFESKEVILETIYKFYDYYYNYFMPPLEELMGCIGKEPPVAILQKALFRFDPSIQGNMDKIFLIASVQLYSDMRAQEIIFQNIFIMAEKRMTALLGRMIELDIIEPLDIDAFILTLTSLCHSAALRMATSYPIEWEVWVKSVEMLYGHIKERHVNTGCTE